MGGSFVIQRNLLMKILQEYKDVLGERLKYGHLLPFLLGWWTHNTTVPCNSSFHGPFYIKLFSSSIHLKLSPKSSLLNFKFISPHPHSQQCYIGLYRITMAGKACVLGRSWNLWEYPPIWLVKYMRNYLSTSSWPWRSRGQGEEKHSPGQ